MAFVIPENLPASLLPIAWMIGRWEGLGVIEHPSVETRGFRQEVEFRNDGGEFLEYVAHSWLLEERAEDGTPLDVPRDGAPLSSEMGYWRVRPAEEEAPRTVEVELVLAHPSGLVEIYLGTAGEGKAELATDLVARTETGIEQTAAKRLYGHVQGSLLWVLEVATSEVPLTSHSSARLSRVPD